MQKSITFQNDPTKYLLKQKIKIITIATRG